MPTDSTKAKGMTEKVMVVENSGYRGLMEASGATLHNVPAIVNFVDIDLC